MKPAICLYAALLCLFCSGASAADFSKGTIDVEGTSHVKITLKGPIVPGDAERLQKMLGDDVAPGDGEATIVSFDSNGGDFQEGSSIAQAIREHMAETIVEANASCVSACAVAFLGGAAYGDEDSIFIARSIAPSAKLGFHAPYLKMNGNFDQASIEAAYDHAIETIVNFVEISESIGLTPKVASSLMKPKRKELLTVNNVGFLGVVQVAIQSVKKPSRLTASMLRNYCANHVGWVNRESSLKAYQNALDIIGGYGWDPVKSSFRYKDSDGQKWIRTAIPIREEGEGTLYWCLIDHSDDGDVFCQGYYYSESLTDILHVAGKGSADASLDNPDLPCFFIAMIDPMAGSDRSIHEEAWAMVPPDTPIDEINEVLAKYQIDEPAVQPKK